MPEDTPPIPETQSEPSDREQPITQAPLAQAAQSQEQQQEISQPETLPAPLPTKGFGGFLDNIYGALFTPAKTFQALRAHPSLSQAIVAILLVNVLEGLRIGRASFLPPILISGLIGWFVFTSLLRSLAEVFQYKIGLKELLTLTAFGSMPWIFMGPALSLAPPTRTLVAIAVMIWFAIWQVWAASVAIGTTSWRLLSVIPLAIAGGFVSLIWAGNAFKLLFSVF
jgi:hypothetical protein